MDIDYHYFVIKTLAYTAGFSEEDAQTIAYYSQQVDDFVKCTPMRVRQEPPAYFMEKKYAKKTDGEQWQVLPHPTGIDVIQSMEKHYRHTTLVPFHFIPAKSLEEIKSESGFTRADYRCVRADDARAELINQIIEEAVDAVQEQKCEKSLIQLGMALHTFADTYAHCGYSGLDGWENCAVIKKAYNQMTGEEEVPLMERFAYEVLPHIGHGNSGHIPDICTYQIDVAMRKDEQDNAYSQHIVRDNLQEFLNCSKAILKILSRAAQTDVYENIAWDEFKEQLAAAMQVSTEAENKKEKLISHFKSVFPEIIYTYDKNERFYRSKSMTEMIEEDIEALEETIKAEDYEGLESDAMAGIIVYDVTDAFYMYNELAYRRAELVLGTAELLNQNTQMLMEEPVISGALENNTYDDDWKPETELGLAVYAAGFEYHPAEDIMGSTMNNVQREGGYCKGYDEAAIAINSVIDSEPLYFCYDGYEWMIELWKGQYGIETGCEIGIYYREQYKPLSTLEKTVLGKMYRCVPDERMLDMRFTLMKEGQELFGRDWMRHWWLTGFHWGIFSEPEQLTMSVSIRFPNREMQQAFVHQGLESAGYAYVETDGCSVEFCFARPMTPQPAMRDKMRKGVQEINRELIKTYNEVREKYGIASNDPNVINRIIDERAGIAEKKLYEKLIHYFNRKSKFKDEMQERN